MTKTVTIAATRTNGDPYAHHDVIVTLVAGSAGGVVGSNVIVSQTKVPLDADGEGSIVLATNDVEITSPSTSFYRFTVDGSSPTITRSVRITDALPSTISWTRSGIEVGDPTIPQRDVSSDYVQVGDQSLTNYLAGLETGGGGSSDAITVPDGTMAFIGAYYPPASDDLTDHLGSIDDAFVGAAQTIVAVGAASIGTSQKGAPNGVAELDGSGKVLSAQLPSYVDDVIEVADVASLPATGESGKIYVASDTNLTYRWTGSAYTEISKSLALGTTSSTAHRGDLGSTAYTHSQATGNPHGTTAGDLGVLRPGGPMFHAAASNAAMTALSAVRGDVCFRGDLGHTLYVLTSNTPTNLGDWTVLRFNSSTPLFPSSFTAKGDLLVATGAGTFAAVPRGADGTVLKAKTSETPGVEWGDAVDTATLARIPTTVTVASDVPSPTDGTFTNTTGLAVPVVNGSTYYMVGVLDVTGINAADLRVSLTCPTGEVRLSVQGKAYSAIVAAADTAYSGEILASGDIVTNLAVLTGRSTLVPFQGRFTATADGTLQIQHSQRTANATATTVKAGSYLTYHT